MADTSLKIANINIGNTSYAVYDNEAAHADTISITHGGYQYKRGDTATAGDAPNTLAAPQYSKGMTDNVKPSTLGFATSITKAQDSSDGTEQGGGSATTIDNPGTIKTAQIDIIELKIFNNAIYHYDTDIVCYGNAQSPHGDRDSGNDPLFLLGKKNVDPIQSETLTGLPIYASPIQREPIINNGAYRGTFGSKYQEVKNYTRIRLGFKEAYSGGSPSDTTHNINFKYNGTATKTIESN